MDTTKCEGLGSRVERCAGRRRGRSNCESPLLNCSADANLNPSYYFNNLPFTACARIICLQTRLFGEGGSGVISCFGAFISIT